MFLFLLLMTELQCYSCVMNGGETDRSCERDPANVVTSIPIVKCSMKYCQIIRLEYLTIPGK
jgi:hypothetical protein